MLKKEKNDKELSFEEHLMNAKDVVKKLESGNCDLDLMLELYESGVKSLEFCNKKLNNFEDKIEVIKNNNTINLDK